MSTTVLLNSGFVAHDGRHIYLQFESDTIPNQHSFPDWKNGIAANKKIRLNNNIWLSLVNIEVDNNIEDKGFIQSASSSTAVIGAIGQGIYGSYKGKNIRIVSGTGAGQTRIISDYDRSNQNAPVVTISSSWSVNPDSTSVYEIFTDNKFRWHVILNVVEPGQVITIGQSVSVFVDEGLFTDKFGNTNAGGSISLSNYSVVDTDGFTSDNFSNDSSGITVYVAPGLSEASDSHTLSQAQNINTPFATLRWALSQVYDGGYSGTGTRIKILEGTTHQSVSSQNYLGHSGASLNSPFIIEPYWYDYPSGGGRKGERPCITFDQTRYFGLYFVTLPTLVQYNIIRGIRVASNDPYHVNPGTCLWMESYLKHIIFDDCVFELGGVGCAASLAYDYSTNKIPEYITFLRCIFRDTTDVSNNGSQGMFTDGISRLLLSQCVFDNCGKKNNDFTASDVFSHGMYLNTWPATISMCFINNNGGFGIQNRGGGAIYKNILTDNAAAAFIANKGGRMALNYVSQGHDISWGWSSGTWNEANKSIVKPTNFNRVNLVGGETVVITKGTNAKIGRYNTAVSNLKTTITGVVFATPNPRLEAVGQFGSYIHHPANKVYISGAGATIGYYGISSGNTDTLYLTNTFYNDVNSLGSSGIIVTAILDNDGIILSSSINAAADGKNDICGYIEEIPEGFGLTYAGEIEYGCTELNLIVNSSGTGPFAFSIPGIPPYISNFSGERHLINRNNTCINHGPANLDGYQPTSLEMYNNIIDVRNPPLPAYPNALSINGSPANYNYYVAHDNLYIVDNSAINSLAYINNTYTNLNQVKQITGSESHSMDNSGVVPNYTNQIASLDSYFSSIGIGRNANDISKHMRNRPKNVWDASYDTWSIIKYMMKQYHITNTQNSGVAPLNYYGAGTHDPTEMGGSHYSAYLGSISRIPVIVKTKKIT